MASPNHQRVEPVEDPSALPTVPILAEARTRIPRLNVGHLLDLSPLERFVLSKVDGDLDVEHVAAGIALEIDEVVAVFLSLSARGAVRLEPRAPERRMTSMIRTRAVRDERDEREDEILQLDDGDFEEIAPRSVPPASIPPSAPERSGPFPRSTQPRATLPTSAPVAVPRPMKR